MAWGRCPVNGDTLVIDESQAGGGGQISSQAKFRFTGPRDKTEIFDDFLNVLSLSHGLTSVTSGANSGLITPSLASPIRATNPGWIGLSTGTTAAGRACIGTDLAFPGLSSGSGSLVSEVVVMIDGGQLSSASQRYQFESGFSDRAPSDASVGGLYVRYSDSINGGAWEVVATRNGIATTFSTGVIVTFDVPYRITIAIAADGRSATVHINSSLVVSISDPANVILPLALVNFFAFTPAKIVKSVGKTARVVNVDYAAFREILTVSR